MCRLLVAVALACALGRAGVGVTAEEASPPDQSPGSPAGAEFLQSVIGRIGGKPDTASPDADLARPVADLQAALERVSETMAAAGVDMGVMGGGASASQHNEVIAFPGRAPSDGPPYVLAPTADAAASVVAPTAAGGFTPPAPLQAPPLSKDELSAVYQAVVDKGIQLDLGSIKGGYIPPSQPGQPPNPLISQVPGAAGATDQAGYYYYFFPIKDIGDQKAQGLQPQQLQQQQPLRGEPTGGGGDMSAMDQAAAMGIMASLTGDVNGDSQKSVEPLFMAMSGFIGMALMFVLSVLFLPKWGALRSRGVTALKHAPDELASLTKLVVQSIEGKDCSERIACEVGRAVRTMHLGNKPLRVLEIILPPHLSKQIGHIRKAARKAEKCNFIPCKYPAWYSTTAKPPYIRNKLPPKLFPSTPPPTSRSTPKTKPLPHIKLILNSNNKNKNKNQNNNNNKRKLPRTTTVQPLNSIAVVSG